MMQKRQIHRPILLAAVFFMLCLAAGCTATPVVKTRCIPDYWPTEGWLASTPERQGVDSGALVNALDAIAEQNLAIHSLLIVRHGYVVLDVYFYPYSGKLPHDVASVTKTITATLVGLALENGFLNDLDQPVFDFFPDFAGVEDKKAITVRHLMTMSSGLDCGYRPGEAELFAMLKSPDWVQFSLGLPVKTTPGSRFGYCSSGLHLLSAIVQRTTGMPTHDFARTYLFAPLGIKPGAWPSDPQGVNHGWGDLQLHPHDMAKVGFLYLNQGRWGADRILTQHWVNAATEKQVAFSGGQGGYGYGLWILADRFSGMFAARGRGGQNIIVWPEKDAIVVTTGGGFDLGNLAPFLVPAFASVSALPDNPDAHTRLHHRIAAAVVAPEPADVPALPEPAGKISGKTYQLAANNLDIKTISLRFDRPGEAVFSMSLARGRFRLPVGLDNVYRISADGPANVPVALKGVWSEKNRFVLHYTETAGINNFIITATFEGEAVALQVTDPTGYFGETIEGRIP
jgi:CubicO group peptidase (beta-lactamase class C family)